MTGTESKYLDKISLTHYLKITGKWRRRKFSTYLESIYLDKLKENHIRISDLLNELVERWLREHGLLDITEYIPALKEKSHDREKA